MYVKCLLAQRLVHGKFSNAIFIYFRGSKINHSIMGIRVCLLSLR